MAPYDETDDSDTDTGESNHLIAEYTVTGEARHHFTDYTHTRQNHNVYRWVRIEPEHMLEQDWVATDTWVKDTHAPDAFNTNEK